MNDVPLCEQVPRENPRTVRVRRIILDAAVNRLLHGGADEVTATRIAEDTGVARTTIYRQWPDQASLLLATITLLIEPHSPTETTGDLRHDVAASLRRLRLRVTTRSVRTVFVALAEYAERDEVFVETQQTFVKGLRQPTVDMLAEARRRGDLAGDLDCELAATTLAGPILHQHLVMRDTISDGLIDEVTAQFLARHGI